jgi:hypothetical protein
MCNDYEQHIAWAEYCKLMQALELGIPTEQSELDLPQADDIKINDTGPVMRPAMASSLSRWVSASRCLVRAADRSSISGLRGGILTRAIAA